MAFYDLRLGRAEDPKFKWEGGDFNGNIPTTIIDFGSVGGLSGCAEARRLLESPKYGGRVLDWGASGAKLSKVRVIEFLTEFYSDEQQRSHLLRKLDVLTDDQTYLLFACEQ